VRRKGTGAKEDQPSWIVDAGMRRPARSTSRTPPTVATAEWGVAGCAIIEAASVLGLFPGGAEHLPRAPLDAGLADAVAAPRALLDAGLADAVAAGHVGVVTPPPYDPGRDAATGLLNPRGLRDYAHVLADATGAVLDVGDLPLVLGGDCSILRQPLGITAARASWAVVHRRPRRPDFYQPDAESDGRLWHSKG
jgi:arginase